MNQELLQAQCPQSYLSRRLLAVPVEAITTAPLYFSGCGSLIRRFRLSLAELKTQQEGAQLQGRCVLVTGAGGDIGRAAAIHFTKVTALPKANSQRQSLTSHSAGGRAHRSCRQGAGGAGGDAAAGCCSGAWRCTGTPV